MVGYIVGNGDGASVGLRDGATVGGDVVDLKTYMETVPLHKLVL